MGRKKALLVFTFPFSNVAIGDRIFFLSLISLLFRIITTWLLNAKQSEFINTEHRI